MSTSVPSRHGPVPRFGSGEPANREGEGPEVRPEACMKLFGSLAELALSQQCFSMLMKHCSSFQMEDAVDSPYLVATIFSFLVLFFLKVTKYKFAFNRRADLRRHFGY